LIDWVAINRQQVITYGHRAVDNTNRNAHSITLVDVNSKTRDLKN